MCSENSLQYTKVYIPFSGFYCTEHYDFLEGLVEADMEYWQDYPEEERPVEQNVNWTTTHLAYAKDYACCFCALIGVGYDKDSIAVISPTEYNFTNDAIEVKLNYVVLEAIFNDVKQGIKKGVEQDIFSAVVKNRFLPHSGYIPFYSANPNDWSNPKKFGVIEWETVLHAYALSLSDDYYNEITDEINENFELIY